MAVTAEAVWHEHLTPDGAPRMGWGEVCKFLDLASFSELQALDAALDESLAEQLAVVAARTDSDDDDEGVPDDDPRLDPVPLVIAADEWQGLEAGLRQRARVLEAVLADWYGPQQTLRDGVVPAAQVIGDCRYQRACRALPPPGGAWLHLTGCDLLRGADGAWRAIGDHVQSAAGVGSALENRLAVARCLPELFARTGVRRLQPFFQDIRDQIAALPASQVEAPRCVLLGAGAFDPRAVEHAWLARHLGVDLVQGRDLTVRNGGVYLKTLSGLAPVQVVLRRLADHRCDPLHLGDDPMTGCPGLTSAARSGRVAVINALGTGLASHPLVRANLATLCQRLLGEDLLLPDAECRWLGEPAALEMVLAEPAGWLLRPARLTHRGGDGPVFLADCSPEQWAGWRERLTAAPEEWVAERYLIASRAPVWSRGLLVERCVSLRAFSARNGNDWSVMPGGLGRVAEHDQRTFSDGIKGRRKDVWVVDPSPEADGGLPKLDRGPVRLRRGGVDVPSRLLDDLYWLGRYSERAESLARIGRNLFSHLDQQTPWRDTTARAGWCLAALNAIGIGLGEPGDDASDSAGNDQDERRLLEDRALSALFAPPPGISLLALVETMRGLGLAVRTVLSGEAWQSLRALDRACHEAVINRSMRASSAAAFLERILGLLGALKSTVLDNMVHGHAWSFLDIGRRLERGANTLAIIERLAVDDRGRGQLEVALESCDSLLTYHARYRARVRTAPVIDLLLADDTNPRAVAFQAECLREHLASLPRAGDSTIDASQRLAVRLAAELVTADIHELVGDDERLSRFVADAGQRLWDLSDRIGHTWFTHATPQRASQAGGGGRGQDVSARGRS